MSLQQTAKATFAASALNAPALQGFGRLHRQDHIFQLRRASVRKPLQMVTAAKLSQDELKQQAAFKAVVSCLLLSSTLCRILQTSLLLCWYFQNKKGNKAPIIVHSPQEYVKSGTAIGLGTGSTAAFAVARIGQLLKEGALKDIVAVPTSIRTYEQAKGKLT